jgi:hypothetical protein
LLLLALCLTGQIARAQGERFGEEPGWIPSINVGFETFASSTTSSVENHLNPPAQEGSQSNSSQQLLAEIGGELMAPRFEWLPGRPRLFAQGGVGLNTFSSNEIFRIGDVAGDTELDIAIFQGRRAFQLSIDRLPRPGGNGIADCLEPTPPTCLTADAGDFEGQGSEISAKLQAPGVDAGLGLAFDVPVGRSLLLQVKPSVAYNFQRVDFSARIKTVIETDPVNEVFEIHQAGASTSSNDHRLGMGLELGLALFRSHVPIRTSLYLNTRLLWLLSDPTVTFSDPIATYRVQRETFEVRGGAGVRFSWMGFASH